MKEYAHLGKFLREKRIENNLTQVQLADALGINLAQFVSNWERGMCAPPAYSLPQLVKILKLDRQELVEVMVKDSKVAIENKILPKKGKKQRRA